MYVLHKIEVAQAFDELSILEIKQLKLANVEQKERLEEQIRLLQEEIRQSIGLDLMTKIYDSDFYLRLYNSNSQIFAYVNKLNWTKAAAFNMERFEAKKALQEHFFGEKLKEIKI